MRRLRWTTARIWEWEKPCEVKKAMTESGFVGLWKLMVRENLRADSGEKPHLLIKYETVKE